jgi:hypothetical protein
VSDHLLKKERMLCVRVGADGDPKSVVHSMRSSAGVPPSLIISLAGRRRHASGSYSGVGELDNTGVATAIESVIDSARSPAGVSLSLIISLVGQRG